MNAFYGLSYLGVSFALLLPASTRAATLEVAGLQGYTEPAPSLPAAFGNREQGIDVDVLSAAPLTGPLMADLFQVSGELSMPLAANVRLQDTVTLTGAPSQRQHISVKFPDVKQRAQILVRLSIAGALPQAAATPLGELRFEVFPASVTKELTGLLQAKPDGSVSVVLFGTGRKLHTFLGSIGVRFDDAGLAIPDQFERDRLYFGEPAPAKLIAPTQEMINTAHIAVFAADPALPTGIYCQSASTGVFVQVTLPILDNLAVDPRAQLALIKVIHFLNPQPSSPNSSSP